MFSGLTTFDGRRMKGSERSTRLDGLFWPRLGRGEGGRDYIVKMAPFSEFNQGWNMEGGPRRERRKE